MNLQDIITYIDTTITVKYPIIGYSLSAIIMGVSIYFPQIFNIDPNNTEIPKLYMQLIQIGLGVFGATLAFLTFTNNKNKNK